MRWLICSAFILSLAPHAFAADLDILRGSEPVGPGTFYNWSGFYFGGQWGYNFSTADFRSSTFTAPAEGLPGTALANLIPSTQWPALGTATEAAQAFGGFVGYNTQWEDAILGFEGNVNFTDGSLVTADSASKNLTVIGNDGKTYLVTNVSNSATVANLDYGTLRMRGGYVLGRFLPYGFIGLAVGRADVDVTATAQGEQNPPGGGGACVAPCFPVSLTGTAGKDSVWLYGGTVGGGLDVALTPNIFLRGEFEYLRFAQFAHVTIAVSTARVGAGVKF